MSVDGPRWAHIFMGALAARKLQGANGLWVPGDVPCKLVNRGPLLLMETLWAGSWVLCAKQPDFGNTPYESL